MKKSHIITSAVALTILASAAGITSTVLAADNTNIKEAFGKFWGRPGQQLTDAQKAEMKIKMDAVKAALEADDYNAWVAAEKAIDTNSPALTKVTADNFSTYVQNYKDREVKAIEQKAKMDAVTAALAAGDYNTWLTAEKAVNANSPLLTKINADNFSQYVQAYNLRKQADDIMTKLGITGNGDMGGRGGRGMPGNFDFGGRGRPHNQNIDDITSK